MRGLVPVLLAVALTACTVKTRGAPCSVFDGCPAGEKCAAGGVCSAEATACPPWSGSPGDRRCSSTKVEAYGPEAARPACLAWKVVEDCGGVGIGSCNAATAVCSCDLSPAPVCAAAGFVCSADRAARLSCQDGVVCPSLRTACASAEVCVPPDASACRVRYAVELSALPTPLGGPGASTPVTATVTRASADVPALGTVSFRQVGGGELSALQKATEVGLVATYAGSWAPLDLEQDAFRVVALAGESQSAEQSLSVDTLAPRVTLGLSCAGAGATCLRDDDLVLTATVADNAFDAGAVTATLDTGGDPVRIPMPPGSAQFPLAGRPFAFLDHLLQARVHVVDRYGNSTDKQATLQVTRQLWTWRGAASAAPAVTSPAWLDAGSLLVGLDAAADQLRVVSSADGSERAKVNLKMGAQAQGGVRSAPSAAAGTLAAGAADGRLWVVDRPGMTATIACPTTSNLPANGLSPPVLLPQAGPPARDGWFSAGGANRLWALRQDNLCVQPGGQLTDPAVGLVASGGSLFAVTQPASGADAFVRKLAGDFDTGWSVTASVQLPGCGRVDAPPAVDGAGAIVVGCSTGKLYRVGTAPPSAGAPLPEVLVADLGAAVTASPLVLANGDLVVGTDSGLLRRLAPPPGGTGSWVDAGGFTAPQLGGTVNGIAVGPTTIFALTPGKLHVLDAASGADAWPLDTSLPLGSAAMGFPTLAPGPRPVLYAGSADGVLRAILVDEGLDVAAPWPKAHHDVGNTGNAATPLP